MATTPEDRLTAWLRRRVARRGVDLIGDDAAFLASRNDRLAVTVDQQVAGVHFREELEPRVVARRLVLVNLSDVAAVGGLPAYGFLAVASPHRDQVQSLLGAAEETLARYGAVLAGGDIASAEQLSMSLTLLARRRPRTRWVRRSGARPGDHLWVGGELGTSALGRHLLAAGARFERGRAVLDPEQPMPTTSRQCARRAVYRHLVPKPQLELGSWLSRRRRAAAIDVSDGLLLDLERLCRASGVGAVIEATRLPVVDGLAETAALVDKNPTELALSGGEDYVLLFALPPAIRPPRELGATRIGSVRQRAGVELREADRPQHKGWDHLGS